MKMYTTSFVYQQFQKKRIKNEKIIYEVLLLLEWDVLMQESQFVDIHFDDGGYFEKYNIDIYHFKIQLESYYFSIWQCHMFYILF